LKNKIVQVDNQKLNLVFEENQIIDSRFNSEAEEDFPEEKIDLSDDQASDNEDLLKLDDNIAEDQTIELQEQKLEEIKVKKDKLIKISNKSKSNFF
tara:strand:- start:412 stop:699 length:288 start_codon:yes stop_codon:yes gene_type:complete